MMTTWIEQTKRNLALAKVKNTDRRRIPTHVFLSLALFYLSKTWLSFIFTIGITMCTELLLYLYPQLRNQQKATKLTACSLVFQITAILLLQISTQPTTLAQKGLYRDLTDDVSLGTSGDVRLLVGPTGAMKAPFHAEGEGLVSRAVQYAMNNNEIYETGDLFSVIIPTRNEEKYIVKTIKYTLQADRKDKLIKEIIIIDDASTKPLAEFLEKELLPSEKQIVKVIRLNKPEGLIRAKIKGADVATAPNLFFLDGHCRPKASFLPPLLKNLKINYKRIMCPTIEDIDGDTFEDKGTYGVKMMFDWTFEFTWLEDFSDEVPLLAGGVLAMTKKWYDESGGYDPGMLEWGGENIEQSFRTWLCGGEIFASSESKVGHVFLRPPKPDLDGKLVEQVQKNQKRTGLVWLDDYYKYLKKTHAIINSLDPGEGIEERLALRQQLRCKPFSWYVKKFKNAFERKGLIHDDYRPIRHMKSLYCLTAKENKEFPQYLTVEPCRNHDSSQLWATVGGERMIQNLKSHACLSKPKAKTKQVEVRPCRWNEVFKNIDTDQFFRFDANDTSRLFTTKKNPNTLDLDIRTATGNDKLIIPPTAARSNQILCLTCQLGREAGDHRVFLHECVDPPENAQQIFNWISGWK